MYLYWERGCLRNGGYIIFKRNGKRDDAIDSMSLGCTLFCPLHSLPISPLEALNERRQPNQYPWDGCWSHTFPILQVCLPSPEASRRLHHADLPGAESCPWGGEGVTGTHFACM